MPRPDNNSIPDIAYEAIDTGQEASFDVTITQDMIDTYCRLSGDYHPLHVDQTYAQASGFENILAHGGLTSAFGSRLIGMHLPGKRALVVSQQMEFTHPVYPGDTLQVLGKVTRKIDAFSLLLIDISIENQKDACVAKGTCKVKVRSA